MPNLFADSSTTLIIGGLILLVVALVVIVLFWRMSHRARQAAPDQPTLPSRVESAAASLPSSRPPEITLEFITATGQPVSFKLDKPAVAVGRAPDNDIIIPTSIPNADTVSKHHARLRRDQDDYVVRDLGSRNGLTVNGRQTVENLLQDGDRLGFGTAEAIFHRPSVGGSPAYRGGPGPGGAA